MALVVVEKNYEEPITEAFWEDSDRILKPCLDVRDVRWLRSLVSADGRRTVCLFEGPDAESVREAYRSAGLAFERVYPVREVMADS